MPSRALTDTEVTTILSHLDSIRDKALFILGVKTGFRISELLSLTVEDVSQKDGTICGSVTVKRCNMKGKNTSRTVPLHKDAKEGLLLYLKGNLELLNSAESKLFPIKRLRAHRILRDAAIRARVQGAVSSHSMRKTFGMNVYNRTERNIVAAQKALGHKNISSTSHYLSVDLDLVNAAILSD